MRKKPPGKLLSRSAHRVDREYRILHALENTDVTVPKTYSFTDDSDIIGTPFYIMEFLAGRIFEDPSIPGVSPEARTEMWKDAVRTLGKFHGVDPASVNMTDFGKQGGFYNRQLALFKDLSLAQAQARDVDTKEQVGMIPHFNDMVAFFSDKTTQPKDRSTFIHGDYKIDNVVFHPTEPRVIGILDWEMATIGHPLSDLCNLVTPFTLANNKAASRMPPGSSNTNRPAFQNNTTPGLPSIEQCLQWYGEAAGWEPTPELSWGNAFSCYRLAIIMQGIAARYATRQASSERAGEYGKAMRPFGEVAWELVEQAKHDAKARSKL